MHLVFAALLALTQQWLLVSDLHVIPGPSAAEPSFYTHDTNWALFDSSLAEMRRAAPDARVVIISGDFLAHHFTRWVHRRRVSQSSSEAAVQTISQIAAAFNRAFPKAQFVITLGNNDDPCGDYRTSPDSPYLASLARIWAPLVNRGGTAPDFVRSFSHAASYTARLPVAGLRAVAIDDVYWSAFYRSCTATAGNPRTMQMSWLTQTLERTPPGTRNVLVMHIPPGVDPTSTLVTHRFVIVPFLAGDMRSRLLALLQRESGAIAFSVAGHMHRNGFRLPGGVPMIIAPAISPIYSNNPSFLRLDVDERGIPVDEREYAYSIREGEWSEIADFDRAYGTANLSAAQLLAAHRRIGADPAVRAAWAYSMAGGSEVARRILSTWRAYWCAQDAFDAGYARCAGDQRRAVVLPIAAALLVALVILGLVAFVLRLARQRRVR